MRVSKRAYALAPAPGRVVIFGAPLVDPAYAAKRAAQAHRRSLATRKARAAAADKNRFWERP